MELVEGEGLDERLARGRVPVRQAVELARQIAVALESAHAKGIIHRDLKPSNIKLTPEGQVKLLDFAGALEGRKPVGRGLRSRWRHPQRPPDATERVWWWHGAV
jgi:serine/threonine-protein kinase